MTDLLAVVQFDTDSGSVEDAIADIKHRLEQQNKIITLLHTQLAEKIQTEQDLRARLSVLTDQNISLKTLYEDGQKENEKQRNKYEHEIKVLKQKLDETTSSLYSWRKRHLASENHHQTTVYSLKKELQSLNKELAQLRIKYDLIVKEYNKSKQELAQVNDKTRKLLVSLDLENQCDDAGVALDFARNIQYTRRKVNANFTTSRAQPKLLESPRSKSSSFYGNKNPALDSPDDPIQAVFRVSVETHDNKSNFEGNALHLISTKGTQGKKRSSATISPRRGVSNLSNKHIKDGAIPLNGLPPIEDKYLLDSSKIQFKWATLIEN